MEAIAKPVQQAYRVSYAGWMLLTSDLVGGPGFEPGASRSRTGAVACASVAPRVLQCPPVLDSPSRRSLRAL